MSGESAQPRPGTLLPVSEAIARPTAVRWPVPIAFAIPALAAAAVVTFSSGHSAAFGLAVFAGFDVLTAAAAVISAVLLPAGAGRTGSVVKAALALAGGIAAVAVFLAALPGATTEAAAVQLELVLALALAALAVTDIVVGARARRTDRFGRDWITMGVLEALGAILIVVVSPSFAVAFEVKDATGAVVPDTAGVVTASVMMVGLFGAIAAMLGVFLAISGIGLVPTRQRATA